MAFVPVIYHMKMPEKVEKVPPHNMIFQDLFGVWTLSQVLFAILNFFWHQHPHLQHQHHQLHPRHHQDHGGDHLGGVRLLGHWTRPVCRELRCRLSMQARQH